MADYIDRGQALRLSEQVTQYDEGGWDCTIKAIPVTELMKLPAADVAPIIHAKWEMGRVYVNGCEGSGEERAFCSHCNKSNKQYTPPYCPHCGAKMDKENTDEKA